VNYNGESGMIKARDGEIWEVVNLPALAEKGDPLGRLEGEPLWPEWYTLESLEQERITQGERNWSALYQQRPSPETGDYFQRDWIQYYEEKPPIHTLQVYGASDYAVTADGGDFTVHGIVGVNSNDDMYVLAWWRGRTSTDIWIEQFIHLVRKWKPIQWGEENGQIIKSVGPFIEKRIQETGTYVTREQYTPSRDKATRAQAFRGRLSQGKVYFPRTGWGEGIISEMMRFPVGKNDDQVDVLSLFGHMLADMKSSYNKAEWDRKLEEYGDLMAKTVV